MKFLERIKYSIYFFLIAIFNLILKFLPFFFFRKIVLQFIGWKIGKNCAIHRGIKITSFKYKCTIGDGTVINKNVLLDNRRGIKIGKMYLFHKMLNYTHWDIIIITQTLIHLGK